MNAIEAEVNLITKSVHSYNFIAFIKYNLFWKNNGATLYNILKNMKKFKEKNYGKKNPQNKVMYNELLQVKKKTTQKNKS